jgi:hypothetical protein
MAIRARALLYKVILTISSQIVPEHHLVSVIDIGKFTEQPEESRSSAIPSDCTPNVPSLTAYVGYCQ